MCVEYYFRVNLFQSSLEIAILQCVQTHLHRPIVSVQSPKLFTSHNGHLHVICTYQCVLKWKVGGSICLQVGLSTSHV